MPKFITILGKPGSGKSTLTKLLGYPYISAGDFARAFLPAKAARGMFVDQRRIAQLISSSVEAFNNEKVFILEGTPLSKVSLKEYEMNNIVFCLAIYLDASDELVKNRLNKRGRSTDIKYLSRRLLSFKRVTEKVIDDFRERGILITKEADASLDKIARDLKNIINNLE